MPYDEEKEKEFAFAYEIIKQTCLLIGFYKKKTSLSPEITDLVKQAYLIHASSSLWDTVIAVLTEVCEQGQRPISKKRAQEFVQRVLLEKGIKMDP